MHAATLEPGPSASTEQRAPVPVTLFTGVVPPCVCGHSCTPYTACNSDGTACYACRVLRLWKGRVKGAYPAHHPQAHQAAAAVCSILDVLLLVLLAADIAVCAQQHLQRQSKSLPSPCRVVQQPDCALQCDTHQLFVPFVHEAGGGADTFMLMLPPLPPRPLPPLLRLLFIHPGPTRPPC
jgi:hypothetical protein